MALNDTDALTLETATAAESLPDPTTVNGRSHFLSNTGTATVTWSSIGATPFSIGGVNVATITIPRGQFLFLQSDGVHWIVSPDTPLVPIVTTPARALNVTFTPSVTRPVLGIYSCQITCSAALLAGQSGRIDLKADLGVPATIRASERNSLVPGLLTALGDSTIQRGELTFLFPPGWSGQLVTTAETGAPSFAISAQTEIIL